MSRPNVDLIRTLYESFKRQELTTVFGLLSPDFTATQSMEVPWGGHYQGPDGLKDFYGKLFSHVKSVVTIERFIDAGDRVVVIGRTSGAGVKTGGKFDVPIAHVWQVADGKIQSAFFMIDNPTMLEGIG